MNCHQIVSGACNAGDRCFAVGSVEGVSFTAYAAGCNIVILASNFERVQIIPGAVHGYIRISSLDCSTDTGKIAAAYENTVCIFEPTPLIHGSSTHGLEYRWVQTGSLRSDSYIACLSWNLEGTRLLTGGVILQLWQQPHPDHFEEIHGGVTFELGEPATENMSEEKENSSNASGDTGGVATGGWECVWNCKTATPVHHMAFSPDGTLFATAGRNDRLVKIWFENKFVMLPQSRSMDHASTLISELQYGFVYIAHPRAVTHLAWRRTSKYMPKGSVANTLVTSCLDNICRVWLETVPPDDSGSGGIPGVNMEPGRRAKYRAHRHKHRFVQRLKHMKTCFHIRRHAKQQSGGQQSGVGNTPPIPTLPSTYSVHDFHSYGYHGSGVSAGLHFHLAASINAETDIPLVPSLGIVTGTNHGDGSSAPPSFVLHWLDNKEMHFSLQAEALLHDLTKKVLETDEDPELAYKKRGGTSEDGTSGCESGLDSSLDSRIESLLRDWHHSPDLLFSVHPIDGSFLIWMIEWLDEFHPGSFRQAQVSFSTRIPGAFPLGDAMSMSTNVSLYHASGLHAIHLKDAIRHINKNEMKTGVEAGSGSPLPKVLEEDSESAELQNTSESTHVSLQQAVSKIEQANNEQQTSNTTQSDAVSPAPTISMVSKHSNGTLNLWELTFADKSKFSQVLSIAHSSRASGHRFRVNDITCHPVLPLLLTTSHHNMPDKNREKKPENNNGNNSGFCSELILWRVDAVGPLSKSGGVNELARINSPQISAFSNVAWIPTLLPSTTLGNLSNSPSACFVASDGESLRVYQAVIDARTLLAEISISERRSRLRASASLDSLSSHEADSSDDGLHHHFPLHDKIKIVSEQSTARPGCVIQLDAIADATHDWQNTQFLHVFQEQLITGERVVDGATLEERRTSEIGLTEGQQHGGAMVDLHRTSEFEEPFYIVVLERTMNGTTVHMWRLLISSQPDPVEAGQGLTGSMMYVPDSDLVQDDDEADRDSGTDVQGEGNGINPCAPHVTISTRKVCEQALPLPDGVEVVHAAPAAGHLSSASIYPACLAPYVLVTACSDSTVRFWKCGDDYKWKQWEMVRREQESTIDIGGQPLNVCAAYSGRVACAYKYGRSFTRPGKADPESRYVNLCVAIYECESTGGSEWVLEDTIHLKNIHLPRIQIDPHLDLSYLYDSKYLQKKQRLTQVLHTLSHDEPRSRNNELQVATEPIKPGASTLLAVPSFSTLQSLRKSISENGNTCPLTQKHLVQLDWVSKEDGSHVLTVAVGSKIMLFTPVSSDLAQANMKAMKESQSTNRPILRKASSLAQPHFVDEIRWMKLRKILLETADGLPPLPMQISWVRDGILVVGMDSEMHVYTQWKPRKPSWNMNNSQQTNDTEESQDTRQLRDVDLRVLVQENTQRRLGPTTSMTHLSRVSSVNLQILSSDSRKKRTGNTNTGSTSTDYMPDYGLFEASRIACPVLPQYHPKQLMELLNSGKIRWVKAILAHLVRCIGGPGMRPGLNEDEESSVARGWSRARTLSVGCGVAGSPEPRGSTAGTTQLPDDMISLDYAEISSIPPLPLWTLLAADREKTGSATNDEQPGYDELFDGAPAEDNLDDILEEDEMDKSISRRTDRRGSLPERQSLAHFGPRQGRTLSRLLTHTHLPGLSSLDQMHLLALADTVATCNTDLAERFAIDAAKTALAKENLHGVVQSDDMSTESLDECGLRFLLAMKHYGYLLRCLPLAQRAQFQRQGVGTNNLAWAYHSESQNELLNLIPSYAKGQPKWITLKELGVGWWLRSNTLLKTCVEKLAKAAYQANQDPLDAAIYYLAMKKKSVVWGLFRSQRDDRMTAFFSNNFTEERWRKAALKNAFALLGKQRFEHAAAFFLLAGALRDAIDVCLNKLDDLQLAMVIARLYEGELDAAPPSLKRLLYEEILGCDAEGNNFNIAKAHPDPFLRSMALWTLKDHQAALSTLLVGGAGSMHPATPNDDITPSRPESNSADPNVFNFYVYLRTHPLIVRQHVAMSAQDRKKASHLVLSGFSYSSKHTENTDKQILLEDTITPLERQLYFTTAHGHFKAGCPALALDVLSKLPAKVADNSLSQQESLDSPGILKSPLKAQQQNIQIDSGMLSWNEQQSKTEGVPQKGDSIDWGTSMTTTTTMAQADSFDWSAPATNFTTDDLELKWDDDENASEKSGDSTPPIALKLDEKEKSSSRDDDAVCTASSPSQSGAQLDIMAQQLKFVACLKILMEELSTLATGFEVDGGQLRYQLYIWLEHEVEALRQLCNYSVTTRDVSDPNETIAQDESVLNEQEIIPIKEEKLTLHEILMQEKLDFEAKVQRAARRKRWLKANETLLRTLVSYCSLHGAAGGGLASVRMELVLLLQELQQEKTQQQLFSPLPFPTTLPLLSASVACSKTVVADPVRHLQTTDVKEQIMHWMQVELESPASNMVVYILQAHAHDMLQTFIEFNNVPQSGDADSQILVLRDLAVALSACIYQCLCDSDSFSSKQAVACDRFSSAGMESLARISGYGVAHHLVGGRSRLSTDEPLIATTPPARWPGVASLRALLARERDDDAPRLGVLLSESFVAVYSALLVYALSTCDAQILYRIVAHNFDERTWSLLFGGGVKKLLRTASNQSNTERERQTSESSADGVTGVWGSLAKQRARLNQRLLGQAGTPPAGNMKEDKPTYREQFVPPVMSMISYFLAKPEDVDCDYDSAESCATESDHESTDDEDVFGTSDIPTTNGSTNASLRKRKVSKDNMQHADPKSLAWAIMRHAVLKIAHLQLTKFLPITGLEAHELPVSSPLIHNALRTIARWQEMTRADLESRGPSPPDFIPGCFVEQQPGPAIHKYRQLLEPHNTPFSTRHQAASARRLWTFLVRQEPVQDVFIRAVFSKRRSMCAICEPPPPLSDESTPGTGATSPDGPPQHHSDPVRIIHKEQDSISAFCLNQVNNGLLALATPREIQEMDISLLLELPAWLEDECELDILSLSMKSDSGAQTQPSSFLVIQTPSDRIPGTPNQQGNSVPPSPQPQVAGQSGRGTSVVLKHKIDGVRRISAHPLLPLYLTGSQDGSVQLWEWGHTVPVSTPRPPGTFAKVTRVRFSQHGNKFGVADSDGNLSLWQLGLTSNNNRPFFTYQCHNKGISDFVFLGSCSLIATAGHSSENKNVALWDTLLPQKKSLVIAFTCHEQGASSLVFAPQHQLLISAGKKGDISLLDVRARALRHRFVAHESPVKCLAIDPQEEFFVTGSADGDIKVWGLSAHSLLMSLPGEHARGSFFKNIGQGVTQLHVDNAGRLFSCGADGSMKFRQLPDRDLVVQSALS